MIIGGKDFKTSDTTYVMGILNVTPDSFSDGGQFNTRDAALSHVEQMILEGADIIDVGGESTRPGFTAVSAQEEIERVSGIIADIKERFDIPISIDTHKSEVAREAIKAGADLINDVCALAYDEDMGRVVAESGLPCVLMHNSLSPVVKLPDDMDSFMEGALKRAKDAGIKKENIILDPGIGFGKSTAQNLMILADENYMLPPGYPVLLGVSRKKVIGNTLNLPVSERLEGVLAITALASWRGIMFVRVHDVKENRRVIDMTEAIRANG